jgi:hypothetical protein
MSDEELADLFRRLVVAVENIADYVYVLTDEKLKERAEREGEVWQPAGYDYQFDE